MISKPGSRNSHLVFVYLAINLIMSLIVFLFITPPVRGNPIIIGPYKGDGLNQGFLLLLLVIVPLAFFFTFLIESGIYYIHLFNSVKKRRNLITLALYINFITVPITQLVVFYIDSFYLVNILVYIAIELLVVIVEFMIFKSEIVKNSFKFLSERKILFIITSANTVSFFVGIVFFDFILGIVLIFRKQIIFDGFLVFIYETCLFLIILSCFAGIAYYYSKYSKINNEKSKGSGTACCCGLLCLFIYMVNVFPY
ncbi:MAG: hypothetical protein ACFFAS_12755 [Promethearchaeota archaeon]